MEKFYSYKYFLDNKFENWDPDKFDWKKESEYLAEYCNKYFNIWWDSDKYNWEDGSMFLSYFCYDYFKIWWNHNKYDWEYGTDFLVEYCYNYINIWWDLDKAVKYLFNSSIEFLIKKNNEYNLLDKSEIIKLKLLRS